MRKLFEEGFMPVKIDADLPAAKFLERENIFFMTKERALSQEIRPLKIAILNLMPDKTATETQLLRLIGNTPLQAEIVLIRTATYESKHTDEEYLKSFYMTFDEAVARHLKFDGLIITGAPVEKMEFTSVAYWDELNRIMTWAQSNVYSSMYICWAAQAAMYGLYGIKKYPLEEKMFGVFEHNVYDRTNPLVRGFNDVFHAPHSRYTFVRREDVEKTDALTVLADSDEAGLYLVASKDLRHVFVFGHGEYDVNTLDDEYRRDRGRGLKTKRPKHYYRNGKPFMSWRAHESLLISNWLNYCVYQITPYDLKELR